MQKLNKNNQSVRREFFWEIPGDVPGYRTQPDSFQSIRTIADSNYQLPAHLVTQQPNKSAPTPDSEVFHDGEDLNTAVSKKSPDDKSINRLPFIILFVLMLATGGVGYSKYITNEDSQLNQVISEPLPVAQAVEKEKPKIYELVLGKKTSTPQSKIRIVTHVVVKGDTLWDIAEAYVKDPFRYPELAKLSNIKNPDLIYPYDLVRIRIYE